MKVIIYYFYVRKWGVWGLCLLGLGFRFMIGKVFSLRGFRGVGYV